MGASASVWGLISNRPAITPHIAARFISFELIDDNWVIQLDELLPEVPELVSVSTSMSTEDDLYD